MSDLVSELKHEHSDITDTLKMVLKLGVNSGEGKKLLFSARSDLLAHLEKEDMRLYPALWKEAQKNNDLKSTLELYASEMESISTLALEFFDKYETGGDDEQFATDYKELFRILVKRIMNEETVLYRKYDELHRQ